MLGNCYACNLYVGGGDLTLKSYVICLTAVSLMAVFAQMILPDGKLKKSSNIVFSIVLILSIIAPLKKLDLSAIRIELEPIDSIKVDQAAVHYIEEQRIKNLEEICKNELSKNSIEGVIVDITANFESNNIVINSVKMNFYNLVIPENLSHINITEQAKTIISNLLTIDKGVIIID